MENELKNKNVHELLKDIENITYFLYTHNKNYTKEQYYEITNLIDYLEELRARL